MIESARHLLRAMPTLLKVSVARNVAYRAEMTIWILTATMPLIMLALWNAVAASGPVAGFGQPEIARYFVATLVVRQITGAWVMWELSHLIRTGGMSAHLLRPMHPLWTYAVWVATAIPFRLVILTPIILAVGTWRPDLFVWPAPDQFALFVVSVTMAWITSFLVQCAFGLASFWVDKSDGMFESWNAVWGLLSGYVAPLAFFPAAWRPVLDALPFRGMLGLPVELLGGFLRPEDAARPLAIQAAWMVVSFALVMTLWRRGLVRNGAFGS